MLNFRKLKHDFSPAILKEGKALHDKKMVVSTKIIHLKPDAVRFSCRVMGAYDHCYESELEIDRNESTINDSDCDCTYKYDCLHLAAVLFYLEDHFNELVVAYSKETDLEAPHVDDDEKAHLQKTFKEAETKETVRQGKKFQKELLDEYINSSHLLGRSPFFHPEEELVQDKAELAVIIVSNFQKGNENLPVEIQLALRLPYRSKSLNILQVKPFLDAVRYEESIYIGNKRYFFSEGSFDETSSKILKLIVESARYPEQKADNKQPQRSALIDVEVFGALLATAYSFAARENNSCINDDGIDRKPLPCVYANTIEEPLCMSRTPAMIHFELDYLEVPAPKILLKPSILLEDSTMITCEEAQLFESSQPGMIYQGTYYVFQQNVRRRHLRSLSNIRDMTIPEPLFGTFVENAMPELMRFSEVSNKECIERFVTLPFAGQITAECDIHYLDGEFEASLSFLYGDLRVPAAAVQLTVSEITAFVKPEGVLARNLAEEQNIIDNLFQDFMYDPMQGLFSAKNEKKIVEFMTETIPAFQQFVKFNCPENLLDQFIYDDTTFKLKLREAKQVDCYEVELEVNGYLHGTTVDLLWDCLSSKRPYIELSSAKGGKRKKKGDSSTGTHKILVLDLERLSHVVQIFDDMGMNLLENHIEKRPLWSLASLDAELFAGLPIEFSISKKLLQIQKQMLGEVPCEPSEIPNSVQASLRNYQIEGIHWLDRLRKMHLNGILADDMGLGKTLQAITTLTQYHESFPKAKSIVVCPTSLVYNWKEEFLKFNPNFRILPVDGNPTQRKKLLSDVDSFDIVITSYTLLQKDIEFYKQHPFGYAILDEAQHIKNRSTRNAQSVKMIQASHRLILTGTPIENSLEELWSLFDFLMPGLLSSYDRFVEKYLRTSVPNQGKKNLEGLRRKVAPFILRRMKKEVLDDLPPVSEIIYHCNLSEVQQDLYRSYAKSAREELSQLVRKEGFDRVQIHVLATLTRLKQICCHPAIFAKDKAENGDSAKYDMMLELLQTLMEGNHKTVIFSQYTRMLNIMREDLQKLGIRFEYLDGSSKNRLSIVKKFNEDQNIPVFLVSLKAGGSGLNLVGADTVIHYDMWWNPAVESQATDRVHRLGQKNSVSSYKLITSNTIEEKILELHNRKKSLVKDLVSHDEDMMAKLTWEEVLELLQT
jgi:SNF2 family DNA or RNA helicase